MAGFLRSKGESKKVKSTGWAAFDRKMKGNEFPENDHDEDPFPPVSYTQSHPLDMNFLFPPKSFSSVVRTSNDSGYHRHGINAQDSVQNHSPQIIDDVPETMSSITRLKSIHEWADESLISDILAGANYDEDKASALLEAMVSPKENDVISSLSQTERIDQDVYLSHRKDAIKMMRSAANHSRAASNAYQRGDHNSAKKLSLKAQEERLVADEMNRNAAQNILLIRNPNNDLWKLDFHGLHASEAVGFLNEHLFKVETLLSSTNSAALGSKLTSLQVLHVITGTGNHSKGPAALPAAVKGFLIEQGYRFEEERPGVITIWPKFRQRSTVRD